MAALARLVIGAMAAVGACILWASPVAAQSIPATLHPVLGQQMLLTASDVLALEQGHAVAALPSAPDPREILGVAAVRVRASTVAFGDALRNFDAYVQHDGVLQMGRFRDPPALADVGALTLEEADLQALRACRVGRCGVKLSAAMVARFQDGVRWSAPDWRDQTNALFREVLVAYVTAYLAGGDGALAEYMDKALPVKLSDATHALLLGSAYLQRAAPELRDALLQSPSAALPGATRVVFWMKEQFGFKPTVTVSEAVIYEPSGGRSGPPLLVVKQLYATHYFEASVGITVTVPGVNQGAPAEWFVVYLNRSRLDVLGGGFNALKRLSAGRRVRSRLEANLWHAKTRIEMAGRTAGGRDGISAPARR